MGSREWRLAQALEGRDRQESRLGDLQRFGRLGAVGPALAFARVENGWVARRLSPDCSRIELGDLSSTKETGKVLRAMGYETGNVHLGTQGAHAAIAADLAHRPAGWLHEAATRMAASVEQDFEAWRASGKRKGGVR